MRCFTYLKIAPNLSYRFFKKIGCGYDSPLKVNLSKVILGCTVGFGEVVGQIQHALLFEHMLTI